MHRVLLATFGNAEGGRLGLGSAVLSSQLIPRLVTSLASFDLVHVAAGGAHTAVTTSGGLLFTFGRNDAGQLGHTAQEVAVHSPRNVLLPEPVVAVATGDAHTLCVTESGQLWAFGSNAWGQLGLGEQEGTQCRQPQIVAALSGSKVTAVAAGPAHSLAVTEDGCVWSWGCSQDGRLGAGPVDTSSPRQVWLPSPVLGLDGIRAVSVAAGVRASACVDDAGGVHTWGYGGFHQLGGGSMADQYVARQVPNLSRIKAVSLGLGHTMARRKDTRSLHWGTDFAGCLGLDTPGVALRQPSLFKYWFTSLSCGYAHSAGVSEDGRLYTYGWGGSSQGGGPPVPLLANQDRPGDASTHGSSSSTSSDSSSEERSDTSTTNSTGAIDDPGADDSTCQADTDPVEEKRSSGSGLRSYLQLGGGQLGVGRGISLTRPTLVTRMEVMPGDVWRQDGGDPFNYQDSNLGWMFKSVAAGRNHTAALLSVSTGFSESMKSKAADMLLD